MVVRALALVDRCYSADDGFVISQYLSPRLRQGKQVVFSFEGVSDIPSTFANTAFAALLDDMDFGRIRDNLVIIDANRQIANMIRRSIASRLRQLGRSEEAAQLDN